MGVQPGDWFVVATGTDWIDMGETLAQRLLHSAVSRGRWTHAGVATRWVEPGRQVQPNGTVLLDPPPRLMIVEATPTGAVEVPWHWESHPHLWSTGTGLSTRPMAEKAHGYIGVGYSFADYGAIGLHALHVPAPGLKPFIASTRHMICSQLVDQCAVDAGVHLFDDGRWPGYVMPMDLGLLLESVISGREAGT